MIKDLITPVSLRETVRVMKTNREELERLFTQ
jgi:hypothetical protein